MCPARAPFELRCLAAPPGGCCQVAQCEALLDARRYMDLRIKIFHAGRDLGLWALDRNGPICQ